MGYNKRSKFKRFGFGGVVPPVAGPAPPGGYIPPVAGPSVGIPWAPIWGGYQDWYKTQIGQMPGLGHTIGPGIGRTRPGGGMTDWPSSPNIDWDTGYPAKPVAPKRPEPDVPRYPWAPENPPKKRPRLPDPEDPEDPDPPDPWTETINKMGKSKVTSGKRYYRGKKTHKRKFKTVMSLYKAMFPEVRGQYQISGQLLGVANLKTIYQCGSVFCLPSRLQQYAQQIEEVVTANTNINTEHIFDYIKGRFLIHNAGDSPVNLKVWEFKFKNLETSTNGFQDLITQSDSIFRPADASIGAGVDYQVDIATNNYTDGSSVVHQGVTMGILTGWERFPYLKESISKRAIFKGRLDINDELTINVSSNELHFTEGQLIKNDATTSNYTGLPTKYFLFEMQGIITHAVGSEKLVGLTAPGIDFIYTESWVGTKRPARCPRIYASTATQTFPMDDGGVVHTDHVAETHDGIN